MSPLEIILGIVFCSQIAVGIMGNSFLVFLFTFMFFTAHKLRTIDTIFIQLAGANSVLLLFKGIPQTMAALGLKNFLDDAGCKSVLYLHRVAHALSLNMTCLLSSFQAITISPNTSRLTRLKTRIPTYIIPCSFLIWIFHMITNINVFMNIKGTRISKNISNLLDFGYCYDSVDSTIKVALLTVLVSLPDAVCVGFMLFASAYMMFLKKHHKRVQNIYMSRLSPRPSPETKATQSILLLVNTFVSFSSLNSILVMYMHFKNPRLWLLHSSNFLAACFPIISPFVLISTDARVLKYCYALWRTPHLLPFLMSPVLSKEPNPS